jgi:hypothetical protein
MATSSQQGGNLCIHGLMKSLNRKLPRRSLLLQPLPLLLRR